MTRTGLSVLLGAFIILFGCKKEELPVGVLTKEEYASLLVEIYLAEARVNAQVVQRDTAIALYLPYEEKMLQKRGISDSVVSATYQYYLTHPEELQEVYTAVVDTLSLREQRYKRRSD